MAMLIAVFAFMAAACAPAIMAVCASEFDGMKADEIGCTIKHGENAPLVVGPFDEPSDPVIYEPNDWTLYKVTRAHMGVRVVAKNDRTQSAATYAIDELPDDGILGRQGFTDQGHPGFVVACWRGDA